MEETKPEPKISTVEVIWIGLALVFVSIINLIPLVGDLTSPAVGGLMMFYLAMKGLWGTDVVVANLVGYICGLIPILQALPTELLAWIITVFIDRHPKLAQVAQLAAVAEGGGAIGGVAGTAKTAESAEQGVVTTARTAETAGQEGVVGAAAQGGKATTEGEAVTRAPGEEAMTPSGEAATAGETGTNVKPEALGEIPPPMEELQEQLLSPTQEQEEANPAKEGISEEEEPRNKKVLSIEEKAEQVKQAQLKLQRLQEGAEEDEAA